MRFLLFLIKYHTRFSDPILTFTFLGIKYFDGFTAEFTSGKYL